MVKTKKSKKVNFKIFIRCDLRFLIKKKKKRDLI